MAEHVPILYIITSTNIGGTEKALFELIRRINRDSYRIYVCSIKKPGAFAERIAKEADGFYTLGLSERGGLNAALNFLPAFIRLIKLIRQLRPSIIHSLLFRANILGRLAGSIIGTPIIISSIRVIEVDRRYKHLIDRLTSPLVHKYLAVTEAIRKFTLEQVKIPADKIVTIYNGIEENRILHNKPHDFKLNREFRNVALIGRFSKQKGHSILIKALQFVVLHEPNIRVYFFGEGPDEVRTKQMVVHKGLNGYVTFMGVVKDIIPYISQMDMIILPSLWEGLPNVLLEAMAAGLPVVASRINGIDEVVVDGKTGILCKPGDPQSLAEALLKLLADRGLAEAMGREGKNRALKNFTINKTVNDTETIYQELLEKHRGQRNAH